MDTSHTPSSRKSPNISTAPMQQQSKPKRKKWLTAVIIIVGIIIAIPVIIAIVVLVMFASYDQTIASEAKEIQAKPIQSDAFIDSRYAQGGRLLTIKGTLASSFLGVTKDRTKMALYAQTDDTSEKLSENGLTVYDIKSGKQLLSRNYEQCSNTTPADTSYCTRYDDTSLDRTHLLEQIDLNSGAVLSTSAISSTGIDAISYIGEYQGGTLLQVRLSAAIGTPGYDGIIRLNASKATEWASEITDASILMGCVLMRQSGTVVCNSDYDVIVMDAISGEPVARKAMNDYPVMADDGWVARDAEKIDLSKGISRDTPKSENEGIDGAAPGFAVLSFDGRGKSETKAGTIVDVIPKPRLESSGLVTYKRSSLIMKGLSSKYIVNSKGEVVYHKKTNSMGSQKETYVATTSNKSAFTGTPLGVTADTDTVLVADTDSLMNGEFRLLSTSRGKKLHDIKFSGESVQLDIARGIIMNTAGGSLEIYLPGK